MDLKNDPRWIATEEMLAAIYAKWISMPATPKRGSPEFEPWDQEMTETVRKPSVEVHIMRNKLLEEYQRKVK